VRERTQTDAELLAGTPSDPERFAVFYRRHVRAVLAYLLSRTRRPELAADVCAEVFATALDECERFDGARGPARAWLFAIANSRLVDAQRRGQVEDRARRRLGMGVRELTDADMERVEDLVDLSRGLDLSALVDDLPDDQREAVLARVVHERDYEEIARSLRTSEAVVRKRVSRGLAGLRRRAAESPSTGGAG
jgi:RNA polymerase sigma-70 factor (ECF subfamily)